MDVIVKDENGRFIPDLTKDDFEVFEDGVKQDLASMTVVSGGRVSNVLEAAPPAPPEGVILPPVRRVNDTSGRIFLVFLDDLHLQFQGTGPRPPARREDRRRSSFTKATCSASCRAALRRSRST